MTARLYSLRQRNGSQSVDTAKSVFVSEPVDPFARFGDYQADEAEVFDGTAPRTDGSYPPVAMPEMSLIAQILDCAPCVCISIAAIAFVGAWLHFRWGLF